MSKEAALRAMREARFNARASGKAAPSAPTKPATRPPVKVDASPAPVDDALCGHRSMNGRTCTREKGHAAKTHRYS